MQRRGFVKSLVGSVLSFVGMSALTNNDLCPVTVSLECEGALIPDRTDDINIHGIYTFEFDSRGQFVRWHRSPV